MTKQHGLQVGEILHNFRGALDHLAWDLVHRVGKKNLTAKEQRRVQFPLTQRRDNFWGNSRRGIRSEARRQLPDVPDRYLTLIEEFQPYHRSTTGRVMRALRNLSDTDKHRLIVPAVMGPRKGQINYVFVNGQIIKEQVLRKKGHTIKPGTKIARYIVAQDRARYPIQMEMKGRVQTTPIFPKWFLRPEPRKDGTPIDYILENISATCLDILNRVEELV